MEKYYDTLVENYISKLPDYYSFNTQKRTKIRNLLYDFLVELRGEYKETPEKIYDIVMGSKIYELKNLNETLIDDITEDSDYWYIDDEREFLIYFKN